MQRIILASASQERQDILKKAGFRFTTEASKFHEDLTIKRTPHALAKYLALQKAETVARRHKEGLIVGADTVVVDRRVIIGKPRTRAHAREILSRLSGKTHSIVTGFCIVDARSGRSRCQSVESRVAFRTLSREEIKKYVATGESMRAAGAYSIRGRGREFVRTVKGDYLNIAGLPLSAFRRVLKDFESHERRAKRSLRTSA